MTVQTQSGPNGVGFQQSSTAQPVHRILSMRVDVTDYADAVNRILAWARKRESRYVCLGTVNHVMEAEQSPAFRRIVEEADLITTDGMPLVWALRLRGIRDARRVYGPDLTLSVLKAASDENIAIGFYGGTPQTLQRLLETIAGLFPDLKIVYHHSPPFREPTPEEDIQVVQGMNASEAGILFVGLGTPKQDRWMAEHRGRVSAVMLGVGAAFDFLAGAKPQAPRWMMAAGLEWLFRLGTEPRRLWRRYLLQNPKFLVLLAMELFGWRRTHSS